MMFAKASILLAIAQLAVATFKQVPFENYIDPRLTPARINQLVKQNTFRPAASGPGGTDPVAQYIELPVNHLDDNSEKFLNRYWVDDYYYQPGGPVFCMCLIPRLDISGTTLSEIQLSTMGRNPRLDLRLTYGKEQLVHSRRNSQGTW